MDNLPIKYMFMCMDHRTLVVSFRPLNALIHHKVVFEPLLQRLLVFMYSPYAS